MAGLVQDANSWITGLTGRSAYLVAPGDAAGGVEAGDLEELRLANGEVQAVKVLAIDTISSPPRARVVRLDNEEVLVVPVSLQEEVAVAGGTSVQDRIMVDAGNTTVYQDYEDAFTLSPGTAGERESVEAEAGAVCLPAAAEREADAEEDGAFPDDGLGGVLRDIRQELQATVDDFRSKGAVGALRDAALDACEVVGSAANVAAGTARAFAEGAMSKSRSKHVASAALPVCVMGS
mmetsp:Transcript_86843/g.202134  ORF Transcript_86843/g.202134 Transcript_86843/m.202134 type:complete len:235 (+) Transcript_86843:50-754(+)|eukprot:CAMPEP_0171096054 /NCGR_PEP_ID=MMETSP0766_2-20121228/43529_1 /TAXON_ID=439317 /ORGANISM="Gambierdiscus australes, Strain CAWD 149" /LENGTH=234 /DNA_ID=CAMNT_0011554951 /DNA_START=44 /DNA_END=748 /DNA_ORIENTATION=-